MADNAIPVPADPLPPAPAPPAPPPAAPPPAAPAQPAVPPALSEALLSELAKLRAEKAEHDAAAAKAAEAQRLAEQQRLANQGTIEELVRAHNAALETERAAKIAMDLRVRRAELQRTLAEAMPAGVIPEVVPLLKREWAEDFEVIDGPSGEFIIRDKTTYRDAKTVIAERLKLPAYAWAITAGRTDGGVPTRGGDQRPPTPPATEPDPPPVRNLGEAVHVQWQQNQQAAPASARGLGWSARQPARH